MATFQDRVIASLKYGFIVSGFSLVMMPILGLIGWVIGSAVLMVIGTKAITGTKVNVDLQRVMRTIGFGEAVLLLSFIGIIPFLGALINLILALWALYAILVATQQLFGYSDFVKPFLALLLTAVVIAVVFSVLAAFGLAGLIGTRMMY
jgi:hypothetical protein